jgi:hypothetical protein
MVPVSIAIPISAAIARVFAEAPLIASAVSLAVIAFAISAVIGIKAPVVPRVPLSLPESFLERLTVIVVVVAPLHRDHCLRSCEGRASRHQRSSQYHCLYVSHVPSVKTFSALA